MRRGELQPEGPRAWSEAEMKAHTIMQYPPGRWRLPTVPVWMGQGRVMRLTRLPHAVLQGRIPQHTHGHDHQEGHAPLRCVAVERGGQTLGLWPAAHPTRRMRLACGGV